MNWRAKYSNGVTVSERDHVSSDWINREGLEEISIMNEDIPVCTVKLTPERKHFYRKRVSLIPGLGKEERHLLGYQEGESFYIIMVHPDGRVEEFDKFDKKNQFLYSPRFLPHEGIIIK